MTKDEVLKLALELLESAHVATDLVWKRHDAVEAIKEALAQPEQEPVAIALNTGTKQGVKWLKNVDHGKSFYTTPPQRTWIWLTDEEHEEAVNVCLHFGVEGLVFWLEATLKQKNT